MMEGKININELSNSQRQFDDNLDIHDDIEPRLRVPHIRLEIHEPNFERRRRRGRRLR